MVEAARPVDNAADGFANLQGRPLDDMQHIAALIVGDIDDFRRAQRAGIKWLTARRRVKRRAIETDIVAGTAAIRSRRWLHAYNRRIEFTLIGVVVIEAFG